MDNRIKLSAIGRLLEEISWEGKNVKRYRGGGIGYENVLTVEVFQLLNFLPRTHFLGEIVNSLSSNGNLNHVKKKFIEEIETAQLTLLPGNIYLRPSESSHQKRIGVQPDGIIETENVYCLMEAKRIKRSSFRSVQLAREFVTLIREAKGKLPLLLLILGDEPPINIPSEGKKEIKEAILDELESTLEVTENLSFDYNQMEKLVDRSIAWTTWSRIKDIVEIQSQEFKVENNSKNSCVLRLGEGIINSIERHK